MSERRDSNSFKRVRQACANCRRKKTRCSGERPVCSFCARLGQQCRYNDSYSGTASSYDSVLQQQNTGLATRVALLESRLSLLDANGTNGAALSSLFGGTPSPRSPQNQGTDRPSEESSLSSDLTALLDTKTLQSLADVYFSCCHRQPYSLFHEKTFRRNLTNAAVPSYLLLAFVATAVRFSKDPCFEGRQTECTDYYAKLAWSEIVQEAFSDSHSMNIGIVQASSMLGVIDYIAGRDQLAWVKFGLSTRFAQTLQLGNEPDGSMPINEAEERRHTFWSVYILDRLSSCGKNRPFVLLDSDCTSRLPLNRNPALDETASQAPTLAEIHDIPDQAPLKNTDHFALTIFMVSAFGDIVRWAFNHSAAKSRPPWDARSNFARIKGVLTSFESYSEACDGNFAEILDRDFLFDGVLNDRAVCHFAYAHLLYHVNQCLLHHPFIVRQQLKSLVVKIPVSFLRNAVAKSKEHAVQVTTILHILQQRGCKTYPSFYGYGAGLAGTIHRLHARNSRSTDAWAAEANFDACTQFLDQQPVVWESYRRISGVLKDFEPSTALATSLLSHSLDSIPYDSVTEEDLWQMCDYSWLTNSARRPSMSNETPTKPKLNFLATTPSPELDLPAPVESPDFDTLIGGALNFDFSMLNHVNGQSSVDGLYNY
ncbi:fungal-specific transcription factor domain-containing protein [Paraphoma chrysanthemicola]|nr:fungal-specific transcription factor domain-containing protein [Paraphoma chrysanthemicola]